MTSSNNVIEPLYPSEVLQWSIEEKKMYFKERVLIRHPRVGDVLNSLEEAANPVSGLDIVFLIGPTGVGKTALTKSFVRQTNQHFLAEMESDGGLIPIIWVEAPSDGQARFPWKSLYCDMLMELKEPLVDKKVQYRLEDGHLLWRPTKIESTHAALSASVISALKNRNTQACIVDEAIHIIERTLQKQIKAQMSTLKSLSNRCVVTFVLVGSYDLLALMSLSGQLSRRSSIVHFSRYSEINTDDKDAFMHAIADLQRYLPVREIPDLVPYQELLFQSCLGCVGTLKDVLRKLLSKMLAGNPFSEPMFKQCLLSNHQVNTILKEIVDGEKLLETYE